MIRKMNLAMHRAADFVLKRKSGWREVLRNSNAIQLVEWWAEKRRSQISGLDRVEFISGGDVP